ncbi:MAG: DUF3261 domain-containing protein [Cystobacterineae bacterium]|nr:DUF3261 domain-containing protein [Cystobacterineae bacterium]
MEKTPPRHAEQNLLKPTPMPPRHLPRHVLRHLPRHLPRYVARYVLFLWGVLLPFLGGSCAKKIATENSYAPVPLSNSSFFVLLPPQYIEKNLDMPQRISGTQGEAPFHMSAWVKADKTSLHIELLNDMGNSLGTLVYDGKNLSFSSAHFPKHIKPEYVVADFQLCFYTPEALRLSLGKLRLHTTTQDSGVEKRLLYEGNKPIIEIEKKADRVEYINHLRGYSYVIWGAFL